MFFSTIAEAKVVYSQQNEKNIKSDINYFEY